MVRESRAVWAKRVERWQRSGLSGAAFAAQLGIKEATLRHWKWQLGRSSPAKSRAAEFIEVLAEPRVLEASSTVLGLSVGELHITVPVGFDEDTLRRLLRVVESR
jgi:hypothetical protein